MNYYVGRSKGEQQHHSQSDHKPRLTSLLCLLSLSSFQWGPLGCCYKRIVPLTHIFSEGLSDVATNWSCLSLCHIFSEGLSDVATNKLIVPFTLASLENTPRLRMRMSPKTLLVFRAAHWLWSEPDVGQPDAGHHVYWWGPILTSGELLRFTKVIKILLRFTTKRIYNLLERGFVNAEGKSYTWRKCSSTMSRH